MHNAYSALDQYELLIYPFFLVVHIDIEYVKYEYMQN